MQYTMFYRIVKILLLCLKNQQGKGRRRIVLFMTILFFTSPPVFGWSGFAHSRFHPQKGDLIFV